LNLQHLKMKLQNNLLFCISVCQVGMAVCQNNDPIIAGKDIAIVQTIYGKVRGYIHNGIYTFKGIPYARAERFMAPEKPAKWEGVRSSMAYGPACPRALTSFVIDEAEFPFQHNWGYINENCLNLNIWTKKASERSKKPVLVWFHGGGFSSGSSADLPSLEGESLSRKGDVVVVSVNHRLNVLGFLDLAAYGEKYASSPNAGLMDLVAALQWVNENIALFGGDPGNVTIFGQSGGGGKVTCLLNAPSAKGLFQRAIVQSGSYVSRFMEDSIAKKVAAGVLEELGLQPVQVDSLQKIPYEVLNAAGWRALKNVEESLRPEERTFFGLNWGPVLDGKFLPYQPNEASAMALSRDIPMLIGSTKNEFAPLVPGSGDISMDSAKRKLQAKYGDKVPAYLAAVKKAYPQTVKPSDYLDIDFILRSGAISQADHKAVPGAAPVYMYLFTWQSPVLDSSYKAMHCMELPFVFNNIKRCEEMTGGGEQAYELADKMSEAWINFAKTGNPNTGALPPWPAYSSGNGATMIFDNVCQVKFHHDRELLAIANTK